MNGHNEIATTPHHDVGYTSYVLVWVALVILTGVTLYCSTIQLGHLNVWIALFVASCKSALVLWFFMHLKDERPAFRYIFLMAIVILAIFIGMTFFDVLYR